MKVFIAYDMEGVTGVTHGDQIHADGKDYGRARKWLTQDVNAAVRGAFAGGAETVRLSEGHGNMRNLLLEEVDERVEAVVGTALERELCQMETIEEGFDLLLLVGYHAKAGTPDGVLSHTWIGGIVREFRIAGQAVGEIGIAGTLAGSLGIPVGLVAGDAAVCREAEAMFENVETVSVKRGLGNRLAVCLPPLRTAVLIEEAAKRAVEKGPSLKPIRVETPLEIVVRLATPTLARQVTKEQGLELVEGDGVRIVRDKVRDAVAAAWRVCYIATLEQGAFPKW
ncbi:MAG: M55 family metallopeptidase [Planctomycetota bacterium]|jgi:D-amino peptidase